MRPVRRSYGPPPRRLSFRQRPLRRSQLVSPFGVGAINDFRYDEALMCAGLDLWFQGQQPPNDWRIVEERLQARLGCNFFVKPPEYGDVQPGTPRFTIPHLRFPGWHYCPRCFRMREATLFGEQPACNAEQCGRGARVGRKMIPVRIVAVCESGHIQDFPFREWIGCACQTANDYQLFFKAGRSAATLAGIKIECAACGKRRSLAGAFSDGALDSVGTNCVGAQPWLGLSKGAVACGETLRTVQRGGSNVYFPLVSSSIYVPPSPAAGSEPIERALQNQQIWLTLTSGVENGRIGIQVCSVIATLIGVDPEALRAAAQAKLDGQEQVTVSQTDEEFRRYEFNALRSGVGSPRQELFVDLLNGDSYGWLSGFVSRVGQVRKLRETRILTGFSRLVPRADRKDEGVQPLSRDLDIGWLPGIVVRGEGIFIELDETAIASWLASGVATNRTKQVITDYRARRKQRDVEDRAVDARFMMVHTLAHMLIKELTFSCGYGSASLRERLYCSIEDPSRPMNGFLIYTASGDSEGSLGGLVAQAKPGRLERLFEDALRRASWCSNDPVCMESPGQGAASSNLAACHGCVLLPETSCEEGNRLLDRAMVVGEETIPSSGFMAVALESI